MVIERRIHMFGAATERARLVYIEHRNRNTMDDLWILGTRGKCNIFELWNFLPAEMKITCCLVTFKRLLKTHLSRVVYEM